MSVLASLIMPHPPLIVPDIGHGREREIHKTVESCHAASKEIAGLNPETIIVISPHSTLYSDYIHISPGNHAAGNLGQFGSPQEYRFDYDAEMVSEISGFCKRSGFPAGTLGERNKKLDHGVLVPMYFISRHCKDIKLVRVSISGLSRQEHYEFGMTIKRAAEKLGRRTVVVASGDLSHKLTNDGPYGFHPDGPKLDAALIKIMKSGDFGAFFDLDAVMCENAAECGLRGFVVMAGALDKNAVVPSFYSYEGPLGVGYGIASFTVTGNDDSRDFLRYAKKTAEQKMKRIRLREDAYVKLARETLEAFVNTGKTMSVPKDLPEEMLTQRAGVFVSIKKNGELRGCIGTTVPTRESVAQEIINNAVASGTGDPRFPPVRENELCVLVYSVDVLSEAEPVPDKSMLDVKRYGVIVTRGSRRGLLLPNLDGVGTVEEQLDIACQKAGISPKENYTLERFEVVRHT